MFNLTSPKARRLYQLEFERQLNVLERTYIRELTPLLNRQFKDAAEFVAHGIIDSTNFAVEKSYKKQFTLLKKHYKRVATVFGKKVFNHLEIKSILYPDWPLFDERPLNDVMWNDYPEELKGPMDEYWAEFNRWSENEAATKIRRIQNTTKNKIRQIITKGYKEGESHGDIAKRIRKTSSTINPHRANKIARTETHTAAVRSVDKAVKSTRIEMEKEWVSAHDARTRTRGKGDHFEHLVKFPAGPDGEKVGENDRFVGTGEALDYPGDSRNGSAGNVIFCRCCIIYHPVKRQQQEIPEYVPDQNIFIPAKDLGEAKQKFKNITYGKLSIVDDYTEKEALKIGNELTGHFYETFQKYPKLQTFMKEKQPIDDFYVFKGVFMLGTDGTMGKYYKKQIWIGGEQYKNVHDLKIGKRNFNIGKDFFTNSRHELGHAIRENISDEDMSVWYGIWDRHGNKVSKYGSTNASEFFSESFAAYTSPKYKIGMLPKEIESFFDDLLKGE